MRKRGLLVGFTVGLAVALLFAPVMARPAPDRNSIAKRFGLPEAWDGTFFEPLGLAAQQVYRRYVEEVAPEKLLVGAYHGILSRLDEYSGYVPPDMLRELEADTRGQFGGLGIQIRFLPVEKILRVEQPILGTPAFRVGVLPGDIITKVLEVSTGKEVDTSTFENVHDAVRILRGKPGTRVTITVRHKGAVEEEDITIERAIIKVPGVRAVQMINDEWKIGYVYVAAFHEGTVEELESALRELKEQGLSALMLDLRFNSGGLLSTCVELSAKFLDDGVVVSTRGKASPQEVYEAKKGDILGGAPLAVLVNRYSASASEIVAGAMKDHQRAIVIGETTFGKGSVQSIIPLGGNSSAIKLTTARYYTPSGLSIEKTGVKPDIEIKLSNEDLWALAGTLSDAIEYPAEPKDESHQEGQVPAGPEGERESEAAKEEPFRDVQLERAVDVLIGMLIQQGRAG